MTLEFAFHIFLHVAVPVLVAWIFFREIFKKAALLMLGANLIDLDHLLADPIIDPGRCSIGYHLLHQYWAIGIYLILVLFPKTRLLGIGFLLHIGLDYLYCIW
jgi:hypothetical protein